MFWHEKLPSQSCTEFGKKFKPQLRLYHRIGKSKTKHDFSFEKKKIQILSNAKFKKFFPIASKTNKMIAVIVFNFTFIVVIYSDYLKNHIDIQIRWHLHNGKGILYMRWLQYSFIPPIKLQFLRLWKHFVYFN